MSRLSPKVRFAVPKGRLQRSTAAFFAKAGIPLGNYEEAQKTYRATIDVPGVEVKLMKPQEIPILVARGEFDLGISGLDWYFESRVENNVDCLVDLGIGKVEVVLAIPDSWDDVRSAADLFDKYRAHTAGNPLRIWTEYLNLADQLVIKYQGIEPSVVSPYPVSRERNSRVVVFHSFGATESKPPEDGDAIVDNSETGSTLKANNLKIIHRLIPRSTANLLVNRRSKLDRDKQHIIERICEACETVAGPGSSRPSRSTFGHLSL